jgi:hypothetical protein
MSVYCGPSTPTVVEFPFSTRALGVVCALSDVQVSRMVFSDIVVRVELLPGLHKPAITVVASWLSCSCPSPEHQLRSEHALLANYRITVALVGEYIGSEARGTVGAVRRTRSHLNT